MLQSKQINFIKIINQIYLVLACLFSLTNTLTGQNNFSDSADLAREKIKSCTTISREYKDGKLVNKTKNLETFDSLGRTIDFIAYNNDGRIRSKHFHTYSLDGKTEKSIEYDRDGKLRYTHIYIRESDKLVHIQLSAIGDTLINLDLEDTGGPIITDSVLIYNDSNILASKTLLGRFRQPIIKMEYEGNCISTFKNFTFMNSPVWTLEGTECIQNGQKTSEIPSTRNGSGFLFGIEIRYVKGGKRIENRDARNLVTEILYLDNKGRKIAQIVFQNEK